ncbi:MAG: 16S rRNA (cytosine(1402)-N(4))-methyltransferase RsmH [Thermodesulfobacteriota bacterium]
MEFAHRSVMPQEVVEYLRCVPGGVYVDGTLGGGGHAARILEASAPDGRVIGIDRDQDALSAAREFLKPYGARAVLVKSDYRDLLVVLDGLGIKEIDGIVLDLGVSSFQLESGERGFSFARDARLDMRMDRTQGLTAYDIVNGQSVEELARILREYGEERDARRIARAIDRQRKIRPVATTLQLAAIVEAAVPRRFQPRSIHPATRVFQALRIAVNDELEGLAQGLEAGLRALRSGGRFVVISFHSLEDRIVKRSFRDFSTGCVCPPRIPKCVCGHEPGARLLTRRAVKPSEQETGSNPRSRSARLRAVEKL